MDIIRKIKGVIRLIQKEHLAMLLINLGIGYLLLFIAFITVIINSHHSTNSDWFLENFAISESELKDIHSFYHAQEPLGQDFQKVIHENLWHLYES